MGYDLKKDIEQFFRIFEGRTEKLLSSLPKPVKDELEDEIGLLKESIQNRLDEESRR